MTQIHQTKTPMSAKKSANNHNIENAPIHFNQQDTPVSAKFDDIYFNSDNGLLESQYVFLQGNDLENRWQQLKGKSHSHFVIAETGFGTGLNFLLSWQLHQQLFSNNKGHHQLHFISFEKYPLTPNDLNISLKAWPQLAQQVQQLLNQYPQSLTGCHRLEFANITLDLYFGDINQQLPSIFAPDHGLVDAWFLDGFAPSKNGEMWNDNVFYHMQRIAKPQATVATFSCARQVKDGLMSVGFTLKKRKGFGKKREMLSAKLAHKNHHTSLPFYYRNTTQLNNTQPIAIIGGGIASAALCYALAKQGFNIDLYCQDNTLGQGASKNRQGALYPLLQADDNPLSEFYAHSFLYARRQYQQLKQLGFNFDHELCGVLLQAHDQKAIKQQQSLENSGLWQSLYQPVDAKQASDIAGLATPHHGHFIPLGGWISPKSLINAYIEAAQQITTVTCHLNHQIEDIDQQSDDTWLINKTLPYQAIVLATGYPTHQFSLAQGIALNPVRGQVSHLNATQQSRKLNTVLCNQGYTTPAFEDIHCTGASFIKGDTSTQTRDIEHQRNMERLQSGFSEKDNWIKQLTTPTDGQAATRCVSVDHLPIVGAMPNVDAYQKSYQDLWKGFKSERYPRPPDHDNLYVLTALGARGLCSAPLCAAILAAQISNTPYPVSERVLNALNPGRGLIKQLKTKQENPEQENPEQEKKS